MVVSIQITKFKLSQYQRRTISSNLPAKHCTCIVQGLQVVRPALLIRESSMQLSNNYRFQVLDRSIMALNFLIMKTWPPSAYTVYKPYPCWRLNHRNGVWDWLDLESDNFQCFNHRRWIRQRHTTSKRQVGRGVIQCTLPLPAASP